VTIELLILFVGRGGSVVGVGHVGAFRPEGRSCPYSASTQYQCYSRERFCVAHAERSAIEMDKYNTIQSYILLLA